MLKKSWVRYIAHVAIFIAAYFVVGLPVGWMLNSGTWATWIGRIAGVVACFLFHLHCEAVLDKERQKSFNEYDCGF